MRAAAEVEISTQEAAVLEATVAAALEELLRGKLEPQELQIQAVVVVVAQTMEVAALAVLVL